jgi:[citrate (pro-3S)-lyase] ligase
MSQVKALLLSHGLIFEENSDCTVLIEDENEKIIATASLRNNIVKMVAIDQEWQDAGLAGTVISNVLQYARENGIYHLFIYTKPDMAEKFAFMGFCELARTASVVLMESGQPSVREYKAMLASNRFESKFAPFAAIVVNCNPFTLGHRYLIETAAGRCGGLYVIVVQEDVSVFPFKDRLKLVLEGTKDIPNVRILPSGNYAVSRATFPTYFLKDRGMDAVSATQAELDVTLFAKLFVPELSIKTRFVGTEPFCPITNIYNSAMKKILPQYGVNVIEIQRIEDAAGIAISASRVRNAIKTCDTDTLTKLLPKSTIDYLSSDEGRAVIDKIRGTTGG